MASTVSIPRHHSRLGRILLSALTVGAWVLLFTPLIVTRQTLMPFSDGEALFSRVLIEALVVLYVALLVIDRRFRPPASPLVWCVLAYMGALVVTTLTSLEPYLSWWGNTDRAEGVFATLHYGALFIILAGVFRSREDWFDFFEASLGASILVGFHAARQHHAWPSLRAPTTLGHPAFAATYALFQIFLAAIVIHWRRTWGHRLFAVLALGFNLVTLWAADDRGTVVGLAAALAFMGVMVLVLGRGSARLRTVTGVALVLLLLSPVLIRLGRGTRFVRWNPTLERLSQVSRTDNSTESRLINYRVALRAFRARPILGFGPELYAVGYERYFDTRQLAFEQSWFDRAHNKVLEILVVEGLVGGLTYLAMIAVAAWLIARALKRQQGDFGELLLASGLLVAYFVQNLVLFDTIVSYIFFYLFLAFLLLVTRPPISLPAGESAPPRPAPWKFALVGVLAVAVGVGAYSFTVKAFLQSYWGGRIGKDWNDPGKVLRDYERALSYDSWATLEVSEQAERVLIVRHKAADAAYRRVFTRVTSQLEKQLEGNKLLDARHYTLLGMLYDAAGASDVEYLPRAETLLHTAIRLAPDRPDGWDELAQNYTLSGRVEEGLAILKKRLDDDPEDSHARIVYGLALISTHRDPQRGIAEIEKGTQRYRMDTTIELPSMVGAYVAVQDYAKAIQYQKERIRQEPRTSELHAELAELYARAGDKEHAFQEQLLAAQLAQQAKSDGEPEGEGPTWSLPLSPRQ